MIVQPYLTFNGRCEEAIEYYRRALNAQVQMMMRNDESPEPPPPGMVPPGAEKKIMHASFRIGETTIMASDGMCKGATDFKGFNLSLTTKDEAQARDAFGALSDGGHVDMPLAKTFFSPCFGMVTDRFGVHWMIYVPQ